MADYTYATSSGKTYDEWIKETQARAAKQAGAYAERANAANESYKAGINAMYDSRMKAREEEAAADAEKTHASYNAQFDANAASALAGERRLQEQMANYGLTESGYNATNRTALAVARSNADAKTRTARGQAVDAIAADLREYKAGAEEARAKALIEGDRATAERITDAEQTLLQNAHDEAMDMLERDDAFRKDEQDRKYQSERDAVQDEQWATEQALKQQELDHKVAKDAQYADRMVKEYVDEHNGEVYRLMLEAYKSGNAALAEAYAKTLWQVDENGVVSPMPLDTSAATKHTEQQNAFEKEMLLDKAADNAETAAKDESKTGYDEFGFPRKFSDFITEARSTMHTVSQTGYVYTREQLTNRALNLLYLIRQKTKDKGSEGYMDEATFVNLLQYVGVTAEQYREYEYEINVFLNNSDKKPIRVSPSGATTVYNR